MGGTGKGAGHLLFTETRTQPFALLEEFLTDCVFCPGSLGSIQEKWQECGVGSSYLEGGGPGRH